MQYNVSSSSYDPFPAPSKDGNIVSVYGPMTGKTVSYYPQSPRYSFLFGSAKRGA